jgi:hypothetical protein
MWVAEQLFRNRPVNTVFQRAGISAILEAALGRLKDETSR